MSDVEQMRERIIGAYPSYKWRERVKKMSESQVFAVYSRLRNSRKI